MRRDSHPLADIRILEDMTQQELAKASGVCARTIVGIEGRKVLPRAWTRRKILKALGINYRRHTAIFGPLPERAKRRLQWTTS